MTFSGFSQNPEEPKKIISFAPGGFVNKIRLKTEFPLNQKFSTGTYINVYYLFFQGVEVEPILRMYLSEKTPAGFYAQLKLSGGYFSSNMEFSHLMADSSRSTVKQRHSFPGIGVGFALGYQIVSRGGRCIDFFWGYKYMPFRGPDYVYVQGVIHRTENDFDWYLMGPGGCFNSHFGIGFSF